MRRQGCGRCATCGCRRFIPAADDVRSVRLQADFEGPANLKPDTTYLICLWPLDERDVAAELEREPATAARDDADVGALLFESSPQQRQPRLEVVLPLGQIQ